MDEKHLDAPLEVQVEGRLMVGTHQPLCCRTRPLLVVTTTTSTTEGCRPMVVATYGDGASGVRVNSQSRRNSFPHQTWVAPPRRIGSTAVATKDTKCGSTSSLATAETTAVMTSSSSLLGTRSNWNDLTRQPSISRARPALVSPTSSSCSADKGIDDEENDGDDDSFSLVTVLSSSASALQQAVVFDEQEEDATPATLSPPTTPPSSMVRRVLDRKERTKSRWHSHPPAEPLLPRTTLRRRRRQGGSSLSKSEQEQQALILYHRSPHHHHHHSHSHPLPTPTQTHQRAASCPPSMMSSLTTQPPPSSLSHSVHVFLHASTDLVQSPVVHQFVTAGLALAGSASRTALHTAVFVPVTVPWMVAQGSTQLVVGTCHTVVQALLHWLDRSRRTRPPASRKRMLPPSSSSSPSSSSPHMLSEENEVAEDEEEEAAVARTFSPVSQIQQPQDNDDHHHHHPVQAVLHHALGFPGFVLGLAGHVKNHVVGAVMGQHPPTQHQRQEKEHVDGEEQIAERNDSLDEQSLEIPTSLRRLSFFRDDDDEQEESDGEEDDDQMLVSRVTTPHPTQFGAGSIALSPERSPSLASTMTMESTAVAVSPDGWMTKLTTIESTTGSTLSSWSAGASSGVPCRSVSKDSLAVGNHSLAPDLQHRPTIHLSSYQPPAGPDDAHTKDILKTQENIRSIIQRQRQARERLYQSLNRSACFKHNVVDQDDNGDNNRQVTDYNGNLDGGDEDDEHVKENGNEERQLLEDGDWETL